MCAGATRGLVLPLRSLGGGTAGGWREEVGLGGTREGITRGGLRAGAGEAVQTLIRADMPRLCFSKTSLITWWGSGSR